MRFQVSLRGDLPNSPSAIGEYHSRQIIPAPPVVVCSSKNCDMRHSLSFVIMAGHGGFSVHGSFSELGHFLQNPAVSVTDHAVFMETACAVGKVQLDRPPGGRTIFVLLCPRCPFRMCFL